jgi:hypothetical protein
MSHAVPSSNGAFFQMVYCGTPQKITFNATAAQSSAFQTSTSMIWMFSDTDCWFKFGINPNATVNDGASFWNGGGIWRPYGIEQVGLKISVVRDAGTAAGTMHIIEGKF